MSLQITIEIGTMNLQKRIFTVLGKVGANFHHSEKSDQSHVWMENVCEILKIFTLTMEQHLKKILLWCLLHYLQILSHRSLRSFNLRRIHFIMIHNLNFLSFSIIQHFKAADTKLKRQKGSFFSPGFIRILLTRSFLQTGSEWQGGTELPQSTGSHGSKQTGMANTNTNTTVSLHRNVATPALNLARVRQRGIRRE